MTKFSLYLCAILIIFLGGCSQNASTPFSTNGMLNSSSSKFEGNVSNPSSIAFFKNNVGDRVLFSIDQSDLDQSGKDILVGQVKWLQANVDYKIIIEGHADERGTREYNLALGQRRSESVANYLIANGIKRSQLSVKSYGEERPLSLGSNDSAWSKNRRVEIR